MLIRNQRRHSKRRHRIILNQVFGSKEPQVVGAFTGYLHAIKVDADININLSISDAEGYPILENLTLPAGKHILMPRKEILPANSNYRKYDVPIAFDRYYLVNESLRVQVSGSDAVRLNFLMVDK